jgi:inhibitor of cysteine peptidase
MHTPTNVRGIRLAAAILMAGLWWSAGAGAVGSAADAPPRVAQQVFTDPATPIDVQAGQLFIVALDANPSTGYHWVVAQAPDPGVAVLRGIAYQAANGGMMGAPGQELRVYEALAAGETTMSLDYVSPGTEHTVGKTAQFKVVVAKPVSRRE